MRLLPNGAVVEDGDIIFNSISIFKLPEYRVRELRGSKISMVFQEPMGALNPVIMVGEQVREIIDIHLGDNIDSKERVLELFREVGLNNPEIKYSSYPHQLSGGEKQRVVIAIALACEPQLLIADEPTTALDVTIQAKILNLLEDIQKKRGLSILFITHDMGVVNRISDRVAVMRDGKLLEVSDRVNFFKNPTHPYTKQLIRDFLILKEKKDTRDTTQNILEVKDLKVYFKAKSNFFSRNLKAIKAVDGISFTVQEGKSLAVVGESGSGKSTVAKAILRLIDIDGGDIIFRGESIVDISQKEMLSSVKITVIFQDPYSWFYPGMVLGDFSGKGWSSLWFRPLFRGSAWISVSSSVGGHNGFRDYPRSGGETRLIHGCGNPFLGGTSLVGTHIFESGVFHVQPWEL